MRSQMVTLAAFEFITPAMTEQLKIPNACTGCHADPSNEWATEAVKG